jgi:hypothetical protein
MTIRLKTGRSASTRRHSAKNADPAPTSRASSAGSLSGRRSSASLRISAQAAAKRPSAIADRIA